MSAELPFLGSHQVRSQAGLVLVKVVKIHPLHKQQGPLGEASRGLAVRTPGNLKVNQIRSAVVAYNHIVPLISIDIGHAPLVQGADQVRKSIKEIVGYPALGAFE